MFALRCTKKLLDCIPGSVSEPGPSDTLLGDGYTNLHESDPPVILLMSARTLLPIGRNWGREIGDHVFHITYYDGTNAAELTPKIFPACLQVLR